MWPFNFSKAAKLNDKILKLEIELDCANSYGRAARSYIAELEHTISLLKRELADKQQPSVFDDATLRKLISLCHPDRHDGKQTAQEMTALLNNIRRASR